MLLLADAALAAPYQLLEPAGTLGADGIETGAALGLGAAVDPDVDLGAVIASGWSRYGVTRRLEVSGGAWIPLTTFDLGLHGGARVRVFGEPDGRGPQLSAGLVVGLNTQAARPSLAVIAPLFAGVGLGKVDLWASPAVTYSPRFATASSSGEAGIGVDAGGFPVYVAASAGASPHGLQLGASVGFGYGPMF